MSKFGIQTVRVLSMVTMALTFLVGVLLLARGQFIKSTWLNKVPAFGDRMTYVPQTAIYFGIAILITVLLGFLGVILNNFIILILHIVCTIILEIALIYFAFDLYTDVRGYSGRTLTELRALLNALEIQELEPIQRNFQCCGIEKYTDYIFDTLRHGLMDNYTKVENDTILAQAAKPKKRRRMTESPTEPSYVIQPQKVDIVEERKVTPNWHRKKSWKNVAIADQQISKEIEVIVLTTLPRHEPTRIWKASIGTPRYRKEPISVNQTYTKIVEKSGVLEPKTRQAPTRRLLDLDKHWQNIYGAFKYVEKMIMKVIKTTIDTLVGEHGLLAKSIPGLTWLINLSSGIWNMIKHIVWSILRKSWGVFRWFFGSGWDFLFFSSVKGKVPLSCCKNPTMHCSGTASDTYLEGCRMKLMWFWKSTALETQLLYVAYFGIANLMLFIVAIYVAGLREKYYR